MPRQPRASSGSHHHQPYANTHAQHQLGVSLAPASMYTEPRMSIPASNNYFDMSTTSATPSSSMQIPPQHQPHQLPSASFDNNDYNTNPAPTLTLPPSHRPSSGAWTLHDDQQLIEARTKGLNWNQIKNTYFPSKSANACRKRHERLSERRDSDEWDNRKFQRLAKEYMAMRKEIWSGLAARTGEKWTAVEHKCLSNGLKNIQSASRAATRLERLHSQSAAAAAGGGPLTGYDDDSGISGIGLTPVDELDASYSSPVTSISSSGGRAGGGGGVHSTSSSFQQPPPHDPLAHIPSSAVSHPQQMQTMGEASSANYLSTFGIPSNGMGGGTYGARSSHHHHPSAMQNQHRYSSSVSSNASYGPGNSENGASPYANGQQRMASVDMGIGSIINRGGGAGAGPGM
ncbi:SANT protein [Geosmithia morbida]|uniref:SANT protein n=1 Tax=Geosmithia morbida TaxID=1094350 RepID=A0A9P5D3D6_9HYPO|nr:SANT protein [Geosmithia morbida]KAF4120409.1 SANT protein [Geosmithia morbida]